MTPTVGSPEPLLELEQERELDLLCDEFELRLRAGESPRVDDYLERMNVNSRPILSARLLEIHQEWLDECKRIDERDGHFRNISDVVTPQAQLETKTLPTRANPLDVGHRVGKYELLAKLGSGGMGEVYRARQIWLNRVVALKVLPHKHLFDQQARARFRREVQAAGKIDHPNVIEPLDAGEDKHTLYLAMKLVDGVDLLNLVKQKGVFSIPNACEAIRQAALGLDHIHRQGLIHRDIKPANLMLSKDGVVKVLDLGLSRWSSSKSLENETNITETGSFLGTLDFVAPEQALNTPTIDHRADLYCLGATLFYLVIGKTPFYQYPNVSKLHAHIHEPPPPLGTLARQTPPELETLVNQLLAKSPENRPQTALVVAETLARFTPDARLEAIFHQPTLDPPQTQTPTPTQELTETELFQTPDQSRKWPSFWSSRPLPITTLVGIGLLLIIMVALVYSLFPVSQTIPTTTTNPLTSPEILKPILIHQLSIEHFRTEAEGTRTLGLLGQQSFNVKQKDKLRIKAELSEPAYCLIIAFRPDGAQEVCYPENENQAPNLTQTPSYPMSGNVAYGLSEGHGLMAFAVIASREPLPSYSEWSKQRPLPWQARIAGKAGAVLRHDGQWLESKTAFDGSRSKGEQLFTDPASIALDTLATQLVQKDGLSVFEIKAFFVPPP